LLLLLLTLLITLSAFSTVGIASAHSQTVPPAPALDIQTVRPQDVHCPTTAATQDQSHYAAYDSFLGTVLVRVGWQPPDNADGTIPKGGYGYCHVKRKHPEVLDKIAYILQYGHAVANSSSSVTIQGNYPDGNTYQVYVVTDNTGMNDQQMRGVVSAYPGTQD